MDVSSSMGIACPDFVLEPTFVTDPIRPKKGQDVTFFSYLEFDLVADISNHYESTTKGVDGHRSGRSTTLKRALPAMARS